MVTISMSLTTDLHLHRSSRFTTTRTKDTNYQQDLSARIAQSPHSPRHPEDHRRSASLHYSNDMVKRRPGVGDTQRKSPYSWLIRILVQQRCLHLTQQKVDLDCPWTNLWLPCHEIVPSPPKEHSPTRRCIPWLNRYINHIRCPAQ